jgi:hypothetical protein
MLLEHRWPCGSGKQADMMTDLTLLGRSIQAIRDEQRMQRAEVPALRAELQARRAELRVVGIRLDTVKARIGELVINTEATAAAVSSLGASMDARFAQTHRQMASNLEVLLQPIGPRA